MTKTVLITGCSAGGLGHALAEEFHKLGYHVIATARDTKKIGPFATKPNVDIFPLDVTLPESISDLLAKIQAQGIKLDIVVNNAGCASFSPLVHSDINDAKAFSKAAMTFISETLKIELEPLGVRVLTAMVGAINTEIYDGCDVVLPTDSWYKPIESIIRRQAKGEMQLPNNEAVEVTAASIVRDTLSGRRGKIWRGGEAGMASVGSWLFPTWLVESILHRNRGLSALRKAHRQT
ncbi:short-chain dehydrogenase [Fusarium globosum]|uniref:Short-chain dehydrogenase n=1 Tax=Fusarium globosum TaxID=78864 RepID=A0A8H6CYD7_9HYPO|nr:short-chain dehydrogenase [Fusarium globosum]